MAQGLRPCESGRRPIATLKRCATAGGRSAPEPAWNESGPVVPSPATSVRTVKVPSPFDELKARVHAALRGALPGLRGHLALAPRPRRPLQHDTNRLRRAAGLLLLYPIDHAPHLLLTKRAGSLARHGGQISLPGGEVEPAETLEQAALREAHEEVGVDPVRVRVLGALTPLQIPVSGFLLHPFVGVIDERPAFHLADDEVAGLMEVSVDALLDRGRLGRRWQTRDGIDIDVPYFDLDGGKVWGATAMIVSEFLHLVGYEPDPWND